MLGLAGSGRVGGPKATISLTLVTQDGRVVASGRAADAKGPLADLAVALYLGSVRHGMAQTDASGRWTYDFGVLPGGDHDVEARTDVTIRSGSKLFHVPSTRRLAASNRVFALGDSRTLDNFRSGAITNIGPMTWARQLSLGRLDFTKADNSGVGGATTGEIRTNQFPAALASDVSILVLLAGVNDANVPSLTVQQTVDNLTFMARTFVQSDPGRVCLILDEVPVAALQRAASHLEIRNAIRALDDPAAGIGVVPSWNAIAIAPDGPDPQGWAYRDGIHWAKQGAYAAGREIWAALQRVTTTFDPLARPNVLSGGNFSTSGAGPAGWTVPSGPGIATRMEEANGLNWLAMSFTGVTSLNVTAYVSATAIQAGLTPGTTAVDTSIRYRIDAGSQNLSYVGLEMRRQSGQRLLALTGEPATDGYDMGSTYEASSGTLSPEAIDGLLYPPPGDLTGATQLRPFWVTVRGIPGQAATATVRLAMPQMRAG